MYKEPTESSLKHSDSVDVKTWHSNSKKRLPRSPYGLQNRDVIRQVRHSPSSSLAEFVTRQRRRLPNSSPPRREREFVVHPGEREEREEFATREKISTTRVKKILITQPLRESEVQLRRGVCFTFRHVSSRSRSVNNTYEHCGLTSLPHVQTRHQYRN